MEASPTVTSAPEPVADPICIHCRQAVTPCDCFRGRDCSHNGWMHVRTSDHQCPGMLTKACPSSESLRALVVARRPDERQIRDVAVAAVERVMFAYSGGHARVWVDVHEAADIAVKAALEAARPLIEAEAEARIRNPVLVSDESAWELGEEAAEHVANCDQREHRCCLDRYLSEMSGTRS